jgi:hypothetical protein
MTNAEIAAARKRIEADLAWQRENLEIAEAVEQQQRTEFAAENAAQWRSKVAATVADLAALPPRQMTMNVTLEVTVDLDAWEGAYGYEPQSAIRETVKDTLGYVADTSSLGFASDSGVRARVKD